jgi:hypothetical protein
VRLGGECGERQGKKRKGNAAGIRQGIGSMLGRRGTAPMLHELDESCGNLSLGISHWPHEFVTSGP